MLQNLSTQKPPRPWVLWMAVCLAFFAATSPSLSQGLAALNWNAGPEADICYAPRSAMQAAEGQASGNNETSLGMEHCPFCLQLAERSIGATIQLPLDFGPKLILAAIPLRELAVRSPLRTFAPPPRAPPAQKALVTA
jgi:hypothetical protein